MKKKTVGKGYPDALKKVIGGPAKQSKAVERAVEFKVALEELDNSEAEDHKEDREEHANEMKKRRKRSY